MSNTAETTLSKVDSDGFIESRDAISAIKAITQIMEDGLDDTQINLTERDTVRALTVGIKLLSKYVDDTLTNMDL
jgi:hypothetical protein